MSRMRLAFSVAITATALLSSLTLSQRTDAVKESRSLLVNDNSGQPFWIGNLIAEPTDSACYRRAYAGQPCPRGYDWDGVFACWAQCPLEYPVECGAECLPQNHACAQEIADKTGAVVTAAMNAITAGVFGQIFAANKAVKLGIDCSKKIFPVVKHIVEFVASSATTGSSQSAQMKKAMEGKDFLVKELPLAVAVCMDLDPPSSAGPSSKIMKVVQLVVDKIIAFKIQGKDLLTKRNFVELLQAVGLVSSDSSLLHVLQEGLGWQEEEGLIDDAITCGRTVKRVVDDVSKFVQDMKAVDPSNTVQTIRFAVMNSDLFLREIPDTAMGCVNSTYPEAMAQRDKILKTVYAIVDRLLDATVDSNGNPKSLGDYLLDVTNMGLEVLSKFDPTGLAAMVEEFVQPICGPTIIVKPIDDGPADRALGLRTVQTAFEGSSGQWTNTATDAINTVHIAFRSSDDKDVIVQLMSGGNDYTAIKVPARKTVLWSKPLADLQAKTLYMVRSRAGFMWIKSTAGGSLLTWVPDVAQQGATAALSLEVKINPPTSEEEMEAQREEAETVGSPSSMKGNATKHHGGHSKCTSKTLVKKIKATISSRP